MAAGFSRVALIGFGEVGQTLAGDLLAAGAEVFPQRLHQSNGIGALIKVSVRDQARSEIGQLQVLVAAARTGHRHTAAPAAMMAVQAPVHGMQHELARAAMAVRGPVAAPA